MGKKDFQTITEPMYFTLLALCESRNGSEITEWVHQITNGRISLPPGTLYALLAQFLEVDYIKRVEKTGRGKYYIITSKGREILEEEKERLEELVTHFNMYYVE